MRSVVITAFMLSCLVTQAQMVIDGRAVCLDTLTHFMLATVPEPMFGHDVTLMVEKGDGWRQVAIDGTDIVASGSYTFTDINAERKWTVTATRNDGTVLEASLQFTFLPLVQLVGDFGYEYQPATVLFSHPDSLRTDTLSARIKWRGGTTNAATKNKRNYKLNFDEDHRFFGLRNDDKWMLDAGQPDVFRLRNRIAMDVWNSFACKPYYADQEPKALNGVRGEVVEVFLGNEWRGIYNFSELMDRKQLKLKKIDKTTGEIRGCLYKSVSWEKTQMYDFFGSYDNTKETLYGYEMKYPELGDDSDTIDWAPFVTANNFAQSSSLEEFQAHIGEYIDIPVLMDYNIFSAVVNAGDNSGKNMYWAIYDKTATRCITPTPWDLDVTFGQRWGGQLEIELEEGLATSPEFKADFEIKPTYIFYYGNYNNYVGQLNERYRSLRLPGQPLVTDSLLAIVDKYYHAVKYSGAAAREEAKWSGDSDVWGDVIDFDKEYAYICDWIKRRMPFIDETELPLFYKQSYFDELSISLPTQSATASHQLYNLSGQRISQNGALRPGLYIRNGKKVIVGQ